MRLSHSISAVLFFVIQTTACFSSKERVQDSTDAHVVGSATSTTAIVIDDYGDTLHLPIAPQRIVSLNPATTEILFAIGASSRLIGRSSWDEWPDSAKLIPSLGNAIRPNVESILAARPDLVLLYASQDNRTAANRLRASGVQTLSFKLDRIHEFDRVIRTLGIILGDSARAVHVADTVKATLDRVRAATRLLVHPKVVWPYTYRPAIVVGGGSFLNELLEIAGATNLYASLPQPSPTVTIEDIVQKNPQYILKSADMSEQGPIDPSWNAVPAVREGRILITPTTIIARPSVQLGQAAVTLARIIHPTLDIR